MIRRLAAVIAILAFAAGVAAAQTPATPGAPAAPEPTILGAPSPSPAPSLEASPAVEGSPSGGTIYRVAPPAPPIPAAQLVGFTGQLLDVRNGYAFFTTGDAFKLADAYRLVDYDTNEPTTTTPEVKMFARATFDPRSHEIIELAITKRHLAPSTNYEQVKAFAVVATSPAPAPEVAGQHLTGRSVSVVFEVTVPPTTQLTDNVYISTDAGGWNPEEIKLDRVGPYLYRAARTYASGTKFAFLVTRGTWTSVERGENNLQPDAHQFFVPEVDAIAARVTVYHWSDENPSQPQAGPNAIPTPYNSRPFGGGPGGIQVPQIPTPVPTPPH